MKKRLLLLFVLGLTLLLGACSGVSEEDYKALEKRVTALETQHGGSSNPLESVNENATEQGKTEIEGEGKGGSHSPSQEAKDGKIVTEDGYTLTYKGHGIVNGTMGKATELEAGLKYAYVLLDWEVTKDETTASFYVDMMKLTDGKIKVSNSRETWVSLEDEFAKYIGDDTIKRIPFNATPGQKGTTVYLYQVTEDNLANIETWSIFNYEDETNAIQLGKFE